MTGDGRSRRPLRRGATGFTLVELMIAIALIGVLTGLSLTNYLRYVEKARVARAIAEIVGMATVIDGHIADDDQPVPDSLAAVGIATPDDPWGNPYQYLRIAGMPYAAVSDGAPAVSLPGGGPGGGGPGGGGGGGPAPRPRQDQFLRPVNSDYDLYSMGPDGKTQFNMNSQTGRDDIVRALDGAYVGIAGLF